MYAGINQKAAPIRFFFLIQPDNNQRFQRAMELACSVWGGTYAPIFAYYEELPFTYRQEFRIPITTADYYRFTLENYDPDVVLYDDDLSEAAIKDIAGERKIITIEAYLAAIENGTNDYAIITLEIAKYYLENEFKYLRNDDLVFSVAKVAPENLLLNALMGSTSEKLRTGIERMFEGNDALEQPEIGWDEMVDYAVAPKIDIIDLVYHKLRIWSNKPYKMGSGIYFMRSDRLQDVMNFWNLRAAGWKVVPLATDLMDKPYFKDYVLRFTNWAVQREGGQMGSIRLLIGHRFTKEQIDTAWAIAKPADTAQLNGTSFSWQTWFPRFWANYEYQDADHIKSELPFYDAFYDHYDVEENRIEFKAQHLPFFYDWNLAREAAYKVILDISVHDGHAEYATLLSGITDMQLRRLAAPIDFREWRLSPAGIHRTVNRSDSSIILSLPKALDFFKSYFSNLDQTLKETSNSKLAKEVLKNIGGLTLGKFLLRAGPLKIIELFEGGKVISYAQLVAEIQKTLTIKKVTDAQTFIGRLLEHKIIEMGAQIQCSVCEQHGFFLPETIAATITCPICRNQYSLPMSAPSDIVWHYRGIGPFSRANKADGVMAVFATLSLFQTEITGHSEKVSALFGFELIGKTQGQTPKEVDLCLLLQNGRDEFKQPDLLFCECKTYKRFNLKDVERMVALGDEFPGSILVMATLNEALNEDEVKLLTTLVQHFHKGTTSRPANPVLILTGIELLPEDYRAGFRAYKNKIKPYHRHNDYIGALAEFSVNEHLKIQNWWDIREQVWQNGIYVRQMASNIVQSLKAKLEEK
ncbi:hypothetical protein LT679_03640 [Mucilaginibacter roseus]|uniref:Uncharacterized protein n=1 Tax=Mucilaginibacter roseus TaxID=1528868 RepID=A0ABS8TXW4_9SPHI|nr:hypothetical protein [Mucilaginibacter roseus]MCD8739686.1 hypothetical protein [Mucilaginibacter roseus]